jgi:hypothetical protein
VLIERPALLSGANLPPIFVTVASKGLTRFYESTQVV